MYPSFVSQINLCADAFFAADIKDDWIARWENENELKNYSHFEYIIVDIKRKKVLVHSIEKRPLYKALLRHKAGISSAHHLSGVALMPNSIMEMKISPLTEVYIGELKVVNQQSTIPYEEYLAANHLFQESPQDVWLEDIAYIANGCTDCE